MFKAALFITVPNWKQSKILPLENGFKMLYRENRIFSHEEELMIYSTTWMYLKKFLPTKTEDTKGRYWMISFLWHQILLKLIYIRYWGWADWRKMGAMELSGLMHMFYFLVSRDNVLPWCYMGVDNCQNPSSCPPNMCAFYCILIYL